MLSKDQKKQIITEVAELIKESKTTALFDYKGITVAEMAELRNKLRENKAELKILKKSLANLAYKEAGLEVDVRSFEGQVGIAVKGEDEISVPKALVEFAKKRKETERVLGGTLEGILIAQDKVLDLAKLPSKEELLAKTVGTMKGPINGFVNALSGNLRNLVGVISSIKDSKSA
jgi:large subunit ribosomal protein L10